MLGRVIDEVLTDEERGVLLTTKLGMAPGYFNYETGCHCFYGALRGAAVDEPSYAFSLVGRKKILPTRVANGNLPTHGGGWFDMLCSRFGDVRVANAIRNRVLSPRTRAERIAARIREASLQGTR